MDASRFSFNFTELDNTQAIFIAEIFLSNVHSKRFNNKFLLWNWISLSCDEASNMLGRHTGVVRHLVEKYPNVIAWHCSNQYLEIAVNDAVWEVKE
jgi:hypothetical protein